VAVAQKPRPQRHARPHVGQRVVAAGHGDAVGLGEERGLEFRAAAGPDGQFQAAAELRFRPRQRVREQARQQRGAAGALQELRRAREHAEHQAVQAGHRHVAGDDVREQLRPPREARPAGARLGGPGREVVEPPQVAEVLRDQRLEVLRRELAEEVVQSARERGRAEAQPGRALGQRALAEAVVRREPLLGGERDQLDELTRALAGQPVLAVSAQRRAGLAHGLGREHQLGAEVGEEQVGQVHAQAA
jgi:hypothetical protein